MSSVIDFRSRLRVLRPVGAIDATTAARIFRTGVLRPGQRLTVDLVDVTVIDAAGVDALVRLRRQLADVGGGLRLIGIEPRHAHLFGLSTPRSDAAVTAP